MSVVELLDTLANQGVELWFEGERLRFRAPKGALTPDQRAQLSSRRPEVLAQLRKNAAVTRDFPLSFSQRSLWFVHQENPSSAAYNVAFQARVVSAVDVAALRQALQAVLDRHAALRTTYPVSDGVPVQRVAGTTEVAFTVLDARADDDTAFHERIRTDYRRPFDLESGPLFRATLFSRNPQEHVLLLVAHHVAADGWSLLQLLEELRVLYAEATGGAAALLPRPEVQYSDFTAWQAETLAGPEGDRLQQYWTEQLAVAPANLDLPSDRPRPVRSSPDGISLGFELDERLSTAVRQLARTESTTPFVILLATFKTLLSRYTGREDIIVGTPTFGRNRPEFARVIGDFVNTLPLRSLVDGNLSFRDLTARVRQTLFDALAAQEYPFPLIVEKVQPVRDPGRSPLFDIMFVLQRFDMVKELESVMIPRADAEPVDFGGLRLTHYPLAQQLGQFDLTLEIVDGVGALAGHFKYNPDLFDRATIARMSDHFRVLLEGIVEDPTRPLGALPLLTRAERESAAPGVSAPHETIPVATLHARFEDQVARTPDAIAVTFEESSLTYAELNRRANRLAGRLRELGVHRDTLVGLCAERSLELIVGVVGILKAGGAYLPIDLSYPQERVAFMIEDAAVRVLVTQRALQDRLPSLAAKAVLLDDELAGYPDTNPAPASGPDDLAYVIYTSGSTGKPKGTMVTHRAVDRLFGATDAWFHFNSTDVWTLFHSIAFDFSVWELWGPLRTGGRLVVVPFLVSRAPEAFLELVRHEGVTVLNQTPSAFGQLIAADVTGGRPRPTKLRYVIFGGEKLHLPSLQPWMDRYGDTTPTLVNMYGITETCVHVTYRPLTRRDLTAHMGSSIGVPIPDLRVHVLDARRQLVPVGVPGELYVGGPGLAREYLNRAGLTAERFIADPFTPGGRLYRTGDVGRWRTSGELEYLGRLDSQVKLRGFRIELGEIEAAIARTAGVRLCAVALREDRAGDQRLVAYIDCTGARDAVLDAVRSHLAATLPDYMRPAAFVFLDALPLTENGKIDRRALPAPDLVTQGNASVATPPETATERELARIWEEVLDIEDVGREDNFFELGGHSLLATQVASRVRTSFRCEFALRALFETPVLAALARHIDEEVARGAGRRTPEIARVTFDGPSPLSFSQERMWVLHQMDPTSPAYNIPAALHLRGQLDRRALERALAAVVSRHEALRTTYALGETGEVTQVVHDGQPVPIAFEDLRTTGVDARGVAIARMASDNRIPFDLMNGPVLKATLLRIADDEHFLLLSMHHIAGDQWALGVIGRELALAYNAYRAHVEPGLPDLPIRYRDFAAWQREASHRDRLQAQLAYWRKRLAGAPNALEMPTDFARPMVGSGRGAMCVEAFPREFSDALRVFSHEHQCTMSMTLFAAFVTLLHRYSGQDDISVAMPIANREQLAVEPLVGLFVNTLILRTACSNDLPFVDLLHRVRETALDAFANQDLPFEKLVEELRPTLDTSRAPLAQVLFNVQNAPMGGIVFDELAAEPQFLDRGAAQFDLSLSIDTELTHAMFVEYSTDLFSADTMARLLSHYRRLLESILADPSQSLGALAMVTPAEVEGALRSAASGEQRVRGETIHTLFEEQVARTPDAVAVTFEAGSLTYDGLNRRANRLAHRLRALGVQPGTLVGLCVERSLDLLVGLVGILKAGGAYVPIDLAYPADRVAFVLADSGAPLLVTQRALEHRFAGQATAAVFLDDDLAEFTDTNPADRTSPDDLAYVIYTSGSTGRPKGVEVAHGNVVGFLAAMRATPGCTPHDVVLAVTTIAFDIAGLELWLPLSVGARVVLAARSDALDGERLGALLAQHGVTLLQATPATWRLLLDAGWAGTPTLTALCGGEALPRELAAALVPRVGALWNMYGPTETTIWSTLSHIPDAAAPITIGRPIAGTRVYVLEPSGQLAPAGVPGELCIAGAGVARGYHHRPALTAEKFTPLRLPGGRTERVYHTGDVVRARPDGQLEYRGRRDDQIKLRGYRIELGEIETTIARTPGVRQCAVALRADRLGDPRLVAYVVPDSGADVSIGGLRRALRAELPEYMVPAAFVFLDALPLTPNGKVDRKALPEPEADRQTEERFVAPRAGTEKRLAEIWETALRVPRVGAHDSFFELGGNSLRAIDVVFRIRKLLGVKLSLVQFLQQPTIAAVAALLDTSGATQTDRSNGAAPHDAGRELQDLLKARPDERFEPFPLTDVQEAYWIGRGGGFEMGNVATHIYAEVDIEGLDLDRYERAWQRLIDRHDMLRAIVRPDGMQQVLEHTPAFVIQRQDVTGRSPDAAEAALATTRHELSHQILPSDQWPLFEIRASRLTTSRYRIHLSFDLLISDAWSFAVLQRDFDRLYADPDCELEALGISFRDYVLAMVRFRETDDYQRSLAYWDTRSASLPTRPDLPMAKDPASITQPRFVRRHGSLDREEWAALKQKADALGLTHNGLILAAYADVLATWSRRSRFLLNLTLFNRVPVHPQVEEIVGDFTSITLLDTELLPDEPFVDLARKLVGRLWEDLDHRFVTGVHVLRRLVREQPDRVNGAAPVVLTNTIGFENVRASSDSLSANSELKFAISQTSQVWLDQMVTVDDGRLIVNWDVVDELFPAGMIDDMFESYVGHLRRLAHDDAAWLEPRVQRAQRLLPERQRRQRTLVNATAQPVRDTLLHVLFEEQAATRPDQLAIVSGKLRLTYMDTCRLSRRLGATLRELGARPNQLVAIVMEKGWEQVVAALAILQAGAAYVPIDANLPDERRVKLIENAGATLVLTQPGMVTTLEWPAGVRVLSVEPPGTDAGDVAPVPPVQRPEDLAYVIYTSGSTGLPKGVMIDHRGAVNTILDMNHRFAVQPHDRVLALSSLSFDLSVYDIFGMLAAGGTIVIPEATATRDPERWTELVEREGVTIWNSVPALMEMFVEYRAGRSAALPPSLRLVLLSGDWIPVTLPAQIRALSPSVQLMSLGGATEASIWSIVYPIDEVQPDWKSIPYGRPMVNQTFHVLDESFEPRPVWVPGQLFIGGIGVAKGYWHDEEKTKAKFVTHPRTGERLYATGDLGRYLPSGDIEFLGREDFQVKIRGFRIELGEIEAAFRQHPSVRSVVVTAVGKTTAERRLLAYVIPQPEGDAGEPDAAAMTRLGLEATLLEFLATKLPEHMCPARVVLLDHLPLTPNGKVDLRSLPVPETMGASGETTLAAPRNDAEAALVDVWREVLHTEAVGIQDNFFDLGGDSVSAIQVVSRIVRRGYELSPVMLFRYPTVAELAVKLAPTTLTDSAVDEITI